MGKIVHPGPSHTLLQQGRVNLVSKEDCKTKLRNAPGNPGDAITKNMICTQGISNATSACQGDSGGPLVCQNNNDWTLAGVVSWGSPR